MGHAEGLTLGKLFQIRGQPWYYILGSPVVPFTLFLVLGSLTQ